MAKRGKGTLHDGDQHAGRQKRTKATSATAATFSSLPPELLSKVLSLTQRPAAFATVCRAWNDVLSESDSSSSLWRHVDLYGTKPDVPPAPQHGGHLCSWLHHRAKSVHSIAFHRFRDQKAFLSTALGLLSFSPLRRLDFDQCLISGEMLLVLRATPSVKHLRLCSLPDANSDVEVRRLGSALAHLPMLEDLEVRFEKGGSNIQHMWPDAITASTHLTRLALERFRDLPADIGNLVNLEQLMLNGSGLTHLPPSVGKLTKLTSLTHCVMDPQQGSRLSALVTNLVIAPEAAGMTALQRLSLLTKELPASLSVFNSLRALSIGDLAPWNLHTAKSLEAAVAHMPGLYQLRLHHCRLDAICMAGLRDILTRLPRLTDLRLDNNNIQELPPGDLGPHASALRSLDFGGSRFLSVPKELERAVGCRLLTISILPGKLHMDISSRAAAESGPLLAMPQLRKVQLAQSQWECEDVEAMLHLRQALDVRRARTGQVTTITCPRMTPVPAPRLPMPQYDDLPEDEWDDDLSNDEYDAYLDDGYWSGPPEMYDSDFTGSEGALYDMYGHEYY